MECAEIAAPPDSDLHDSGQRRGESPEVVGFGVSREVHEGVGQRTQCIPGRELATLFHSGVLKRLNEFGVLSQITTSPQY